MCFWISPKASTAWRVWFTCPAPTAKALIAISFTPCGCVLVETSTWLIEKNCRRPKATWNIIFCLVFLLGGPIFGRCLNSTREYIKWHVRSTSFFWKYVKIGWNLHFWTYVHHNVCSRNAHHILYIPNIHFLVYCDMLLYSYIFKLSKIYNLAKLKYFTGILPPVHCASCSTTQCTLSVVCVNLIQPLLGWSKNIHYPLTLEATGLCHCNAHVEKISLQDPCYIILSWKWWPKFETTSLICASHPLQACRSPPIQVPKKHAPKIFVDLLCQPEKRFRHVKEPISTVSKLVDVIRHRMNSSWHQFHRDLQTNKTHPFCHQSFYTLTLSKPTNVVLSLTQRSSIIFYQKTHTHKKHQNQDQKNYDGAENKDEWFTGYSASSSPQSWPF